MITLNVYPGGKERALTFSYDDGQQNDIRLIGLFNQYGMKATFHLNSHMFLGKSDEELMKIREQYQGHEIACHTVRHGHPDYMTPLSLVKETLEDRLMLEKIAGYPVTGMSYPFGAYGAATVDAMKSCGIVYSRTTNATMNFAVPEDFMKWHPTCHHNDALGLVDRFLGMIKTDWAGSIFYIWGHSFELRTEENWADMEKLLSRLAGNDKVWYATNHEIYDYVTAQKAMDISADERIFVNRSVLDLWVRKNGRIVKIPAGSTVIDE